MTLSMDELYTKLEGLAEELHIRGFDSFLSSTCVLGEDPQATLTLFRNASDESEFIDVKFRVTGEKDLSAQVFGGAGVEWSDMRREAIAKISKFIGSDVMSLWAATPGAFGVFKPSDREKFLTLSKEHQDLFISVLAEFLDGWRKADWLDEENVARVASWIGRTCDELVLRASEDLVIRMLEGQNIERDRTLATFRENFEKGSSMRDEGMNIGHD